MQVWQPDPVTLLIPKDLPPLVLDRLRVALTYTDLSVMFEVRKVRKQAWRFQNEMDWKAEIARLLKLSEVCLLRDCGDHYETHSGLSELVCRTLGADLKLNFSYPEPDPLPFSHPPSFDPHPYQREALDRLTEKRHAGIQHGTGLGKSLIIALAIRRLGLRTLVLAPNTSVAEQLHQVLSGWFGEKYVGAYFDGKKKIKHITVGNAQTLTRIHKDHSDFGKLRQSQVFIADESHLCPASTLAHICFGLAREAPYRFFFSATQMRNDGADLLLDGITGPIVHEMTVRQGIEGGYLARPYFHMTSVPSHGVQVFSDPMKNQRHHLFYNPAVVRQVGMLCNTAFRAGVPTLVLTREVEQFNRLLPYLRVPVSFAHGTLGKGESVQPEFRKSDPNRQVAEFNAGRSKLLVGTTCISTGTDIKPTRLLIYWQGGSSEVQVRQAIGRGTRLDAGKTSFHVQDFWPLSPSGDRLKIDGGNPDIRPTSWGPGYHAKARKDIYDDISGPVEESSAP